jgi:hypothetical protein
VPLRSYHVGSGWDIHGRRGMQRGKNNPAGRSDTSINSAKHDIGGTQIEEED